ncbi:MAG: MBL fold metallo-hydrolase [Anaerolineae bacterium]|nr:MBL fold metallo-hydrolase [Anaerolineae bacterium]
MVRIDRVAEDIYAFMSEMYLQVVCTALLTEAGAILIDALPFASEAEQVRRFVERKLGPDSVRYVINTHYHPDHVYGTYVFEGAEVIAHERTRELLERIGKPRLERARRETPALAGLELKLPAIVFHQEMDLLLGGRDVHLFHSPGHTPDSSSAFIGGDKVLVAGDLVMPVPYLVEGNIEEFRASLQTVRELRPNFVVQGHGQVLLRGEVGEMVKSSLAYVDQVIKRVDAVIAAGDPPSALREIGIEECGKSRIPLDGMVSKLHLDNLIALYKRKTGLA